MLCAATDKPDYREPDMTAVDDNYTGHVEPGTAARRTLPGATIVKASVGPMDNNAYLITCSQTGETLLIDAANDAGVLLELIAQHAPKLSLIVTSHQHQDHWLALAEVADGHRRARPPRTSSTPSRFRSNPTGSSPTATPSRSATLSFDVIHLQGHTEGSVALALQRRRRRRRRAAVHRRLPVSRRRRQDVEATATSSGCSATSPAESSTSIPTRRSCTPGHGDDTTLGAERPHLAEWQERGF